MSIYRLKQFMWAIPAPLTKVDPNMLRIYLNEEELNLFRKLKISEQQHCIRVCKDALIESDCWNSIDKNKMAKVALLHDIGKIERKLSVIDKSIIVILDKITNGKLKKYSSLKKVDVYYNHPQKSSNILRSISIYDYELLEAIEKHHNKECSDNCYLEIIKKCDNNN